MRFLLDSHALLWLLNGSREMPSRTRDALTADGTEIWFSPVAIYELGLQVTLRRLAAFPRPMRDIALEQSLTELAIDSSHAARAAALPLIHRDPLDRVIAAQAIVEDMTVVTRDPKIAALGARTLW